MDSEIFYILDLWMKVHKLSTENYLKFYKKIELQNEIRHIYYIYNTFYNKTFTKENATISEMQYVSDLVIEHSDKSDKLIVTLDTRGKLGGCFMSKNGIVSHLKKIDYKNSNENENNDFDRYD